MDLTEYLKNSEFIAKGKGYLHDTVANISVCCEHSLVTGYVCPKQANASLHISRYLENQAKTATGISEFPDKDYAI